MVPTFGSDVPRHIAMHEEGVAIVPPRTPQIDLIHSFSSDEVAPIEDVAVWLMLGSGGSCDVGIGEALDGAVLKPSRRGSKDEVGGATDVASLEIKACLGHARVDGVLMTDESAVDEHEAITFRVQRHSLSQTG